MPRKTKSRPEVVGLFGVGLDNDDGHVRVTRNDDIVLVGGSEPTHTKLHDVAIHFNESLKNRGKRLRDASADEVAELLQRAIEK